MPRSGGGAGTGLAAAAMVIAVVALILPIVHPFGTGPTGAAGTPATRMWAEVWANGTVANSSGVNVTTTGFFATGEYQVLFDQNVRACAYVATIGIPGSYGSGVPLPGYATTAGRLTSTYGVWVETFNATGAFTDENFTLAVFC